MKDRQIAARACAATSSAPRAFTDDQQRIDLRELRGQAARAEVRREIRTPLPMPRRASITAKREILRQRGILQAVVHDDEAGALRACDAAPATRSRATTVGATRASRRASSPTCAARSACASTSFGPADIAAVTAAETKWALARPASIRASNITVGVLPAPPSVKLPTQRTGTPAGVPFAPCVLPRLRHRRARPVPAGSQATPALRHQKAGSRMAARCSNCSCIR